MTDVDDEEPDMEMEEGTQAKGSSGEQAKNLDRVTDVVQQQELDKDRVQKAMLKLAEETKEKKEKEAEREKLLAKVQIKAEDVDIIADELEMDKKVAERHLRENDGDVNKTLTFLITYWPEGTPTVPRDAEDYIPLVLTPKTKRKARPPPPPPAPPAEVEAPATPKQTPAPTPANSRPSSAKPSSARGKGGKKRK